jgi:hypothetical protein
LSLLTVLLLAFPTTTRSSSSSSTSTCVLPVDARTLLANTLTMREVVDPNLQTIRVQLTYQGTGWLGFGISPNGHMIGSQAIIGRPDLNNSVMLYDLMAQSNSGIKLSSEQPLTQTSFTQVNGVTTLTFTKPLASTTGTSILASGPNNFLYAYGATNAFLYHAGRSPFTITTALVACSSNGTTPSNNHTVANGPIKITKDTSQTTRKLWKIHGLLLALAWGVLAPLAIGCAVLRRWLGGGALWFTLHSNLNTLTLLATAAGFGIAVYNMHVEHKPHFQGPKHTLIGLLVMILVLVQAMSGWFRPHLPKEAHAAAAANASVNVSTTSHLNTSHDHEENGEERPLASNNNFNSYEQPGYNKKSAARRIFEVQHRILGLGLLGLCWYQVYLGILQYNGRYALTFPATLVFFVVAGVLAGATIVGKIVLLLFRQG